MTTGPPGPVVATLTSGQPSHLPIVLTAADQRGGAWSTHALIRLDSREDFTSPAVCVIVEAVGDAVRAAVRSVHLAITLPGSTLSSVKDPGDSEIHDGNDEKAVTDTDTGRASPRQQATSHEEDHRGDDVDRPGVALHGRPGGHAVILAPPAPERSLLRYGEQLYVQVIAADAVATWRPDATGHRSRPFHLSTSRTVRTAAD
jgi:hypothetical protein